MGYLLIVTPLVLLMCFIALAWSRSRGQTRRNSEALNSAAAKVGLAENRFISSSALEDLKHRRARKHVKTPQVGAITSPPPRAPHVGKSGIDERQDRGELKAACIEALDAAAVEHPAGHGKQFARYILRSAAGERIELMFEKGEKSAANLWLANRHLGDLTAAGIEYRIYPAAALYQTEDGEGQKAYGRHSALKSMRGLANADLVRFTIATTKQMEAILTKLMQAGQTA